MSCPFSSRSRSSRSLCPILIVWVELNRPPQSTADSYSTNEDADLTIPTALGVLANDLHENGDEATVVSVGGNQSRKHITTYFRHDFEVELPSLVQALSVEVLWDDGVAVCLNGIEIVRDNLIENAERLIRQLRLVHLYRE